MSGFSDPHFRLTPGIQAALLYTRKRNRLDTAVVNSTVASAYGSIFFPANPSNLDTITVAGTVLTFVSGSPSGAQVKIVTTEDDAADNLAATLAAAAAYFAANPVASAYVNLSGAASLLIESVKPADTSVTLAASAARVSGSNLVQQVVRTRLSANSIPVTP